MIPAFKQSLVSGFTQLCCMLLFSDLFTSPLRHLSSHSHHHTIPEFIAGPISKEQFTEKISPPVVYRKCLSSRPFPSFFLLAVTRIWSSLKTSEFLAPFSAFE